MDRQAEPARHFRRVAGDIGCSEKTVRNIANDYIAKKNQGYKPSCRRSWHQRSSLAGRHRCVLTDIEQRKPVDLLIDCKKSTVSGWLWQFSETSSPRVVTIDLCRSFRNTVHAVFPKVPVVVDKFHVIRLANAAVDRSRIGIAKNRTPKQGQEWMKSKALLLKRGHGLSTMDRMILEILLLSEPDMATAYHLKEAFCNIYISWGKTRPRRPRKLAFLRTETQCATTSRICSVRPRTGGQRSSPIPTTRRRPPPLTGAEWS